MCSTCPDEKSSQPVTSGSASVAVLAVSMISSKSAGRSLSKEAASADASPPDLASSGFLDTVDIICPSSLREYSIQDFKGEFFLTNPTHTSHEVEQPHGPREEWEECDNDQELHPVEKSTERSRGDISQHNTAEHAHRHPQNQYSKRKPRGKNFILADCGHARCAQAQHSRHAQGQHVADSVEQA